MWSEQIDGYCERVDFAFWAEPVNAVTNLAFLIAAFVMWRRIKGQNMPLAMALISILTAIGVGSFLFHTLATQWASLADVVPILCFILLYIYIANRTFWGLGFWVSIGLTALFFPYAALTVPLFGQLSFLGSSAAYAPVALLIFAYAVLLRRRCPETARGLFIGASILVLSLAFRSADLPVCGSIPIGTHFMWHILNGLMLGWMIEVYRRHVFADLKQKATS